MVPKPRAVFDDPEKFWNFLTASSDRLFEGQHFDRKEACRAQADGHARHADLKSFREQVQECLSAFANENKDGGLLVVGISSTGDLKGLAHLTESQLNDLLRVDDLLVHHNSSVRLFDVTNEAGGSERIALFYVPYAARAICETVGKTPRAWRRKGMQNLPVSDQEREQIKRDKRIVDFELTPCGPFVEGDLDLGVLKEFQHGYLDAASYDWTDSDLLSHVGAILRDEHSAHVTHAGALFFSANPQRELPHANIRLLHFEVALSKRENRPLPTFDKSFAGPITKQIRDFRTFARESAFFKTYRKRKPEGGFIEEPEYPPIAVDEAVVNAVAHRDYAISVPIVCEKYTDAFVIRSPGPLVQRKEVPEHFSLDETSLEHLPRNPKLMDWLRRLKDPHGAPFVFALQEGTRRMRDETAKMGLPAPEYLSSWFTEVILRNEAARRETETEQEAQTDFPEFTNLYALVDPRVRSSAESENRRREILRALADRLAALDWFIDTFRFGLVTAHRRGAAVQAPPEVSKIVRIYPATHFQIREYYNRTYLLVDATAVVQSVLTLGAALRLFDSAELIGSSGLAQWRGWQRVSVRSIDGDYCRVHLTGYGKTRSVSRFSTEI